MANWSYSVHPAHPYSLDFSSHCVLKSQNPKERCKKTQTKCHFNELWELSTLWWPRWVGFGEGVGRSKGRGYVYMYSWCTLLYSRNQHDIGRQLFSSLKKKYTSRRQDSFVIFVMLCFRIVLQRTLSVEIRDFYSVKIRLNIDICRIS